MNASERTSTIRQERMDTAGRAHLRVGSKIYEVLNVASFGLAFTSHAEFKLGAEFVEAELAIGGVEFDCPTLRVARCSKFAEDYVVGVETVDSFFDADGIRGYCQGCDVAESLARLDAKGNALPEGFRTLVLSIKGELANAKEKINRIEKEASKNHELESERISFEASFTSAVASRFSTLLAQSYLAFAKHMADMDAETKKSAMAFFREHLEPYIYGSVFSRRSLEKPSGYAGDHRMMSILYRDDLVGASLYDKCVHRYFLSNENAQAVRNRRRYLNEKIFSAVEAKRDGVAHVLAVASGPAQEIVDMVATADADFFRRVEFTLLDQDQNSLLFAQKSIVEKSKMRGITPVVHYLNMNIKRVTRERLLGSYELIYSAGLFDYFEDDVARKIAAGLFDHVATSGSMVLGNFRADAANQALMELALDWYLIYRNEDHLERLYGGIAPSLRIESEPMSINLFAVFSK